MSAPDGPRVAATIADGIAEIVLAAADRSNAVDLAAARELRDAARGVAEAGGAARALLVRAEGRNFCVGGDLPAFDTQGDGVGEYLAEATALFHEGIELLLGLDIPVVVAAQGAIAGVGVGLAVLGDVVILSDDAVIRLAYTGVGLSPDGGSSHLLPRLLGSRLAASLMLTNRPLPAAEALQRGLADAVVPVGELPARAGSTVRELALLDPLAVAATKGLLRASPAASLHEQLAAEAASISALSTRPAAREALRAFAERKRERASSRDERTG